MFGNTADHERQTGKEEASAFHSCDNQSSERDVAATVGSIMHSDPETLQEYDRLLKRFAFTLEMAMKCDISAEQKHRIVTALREKFEGELAELRGRSSVPRPRPVSSLASAEARALSAAVIEHCQFMSNEDIPQLGISKDVLIGPSELVFIIHGHESEKIRAVLGMTVISEGMCEEMTTRVFTALVLQARILKDALAPFEPRPSEGQVSQDCVHGVSSIAPRF